MTAVPSPASVRPVPAFDATIEPHSAAEAPDPGQRYRVAFSVTKRPARPMH